MAHDSHFYGALVVAIALVALLVFQGLWHGGICARERWQRWHQLNPQQTPSSDRFRANRGSDCDEEAGGLQRNVDAELASVDEAAAASPTDRDAQEASKTTQLN